MPDDSVACRLIIEQLHCLRKEVAEIREDIADLKASRSESDGERSALAKLGAVVIGLCTLIGVVVTMMMDWPKLSGH